MQDYYDEQEIDLLDLLYKVLIHIKRIIIVAIIFGVIFGGYKFVKTSNEDKIAKALVENRSEALEIYSNKVSLQDIYDVLTYETNLNNYDKKIDYLENSIYLNLENNNENNGYSILLKSIGNNQDIINYIKSTIINDKLIDDFSNKYNIENNSKYYSKAYFVNELISIYTPVATSENEEVNTITITITTDNKEKSEYLGNLIIDSINANKQAIKNNVDADVSIMDAESIYQDNKDIENEKDTLQKEISTLSSTIEKSQEDFNNIQSRYYAYKNGLEVSKTAIVKSTIKFVLVGLIVGIFVACAYYGIIYMLNGKIHTADDLKYINIKVLGSISQNTDNNKFLKKIFDKKALDSKKSLNNINEKIKALKGKNTVVLATTLKEDSIKAIANKIAKELKIKDIYFDITNNSKILKANKNNIVLLEVLEQTKTSQLVNVSELVKDYKLNLLGSILIDNE